MSRTAKDLTGQRFGRLVVLSEAEPYVDKTGHKARRWLCQCDCGRQLVVHQSSLIRGRTKSCGCYRREVVSQSQDLTGQRFGRLTVLGPAEPVDYNGRRVLGWNCLCDCGSQIVASGDHLRSGHTRSCGCYQREQTAKVNDKGDLTGQRFGRLVVLGLGKPYVSPDGGSARRWKCRCDCGKEVLVMRKQLISGDVKSCGCYQREQAAQRLDGSLGRGDGTNVSYIRSDKPRSGNKSGIKGISWDGRKEKWRARLQIRGRTLNLGYYKRLEDAAKARARAEEEYYRPIIDAYDADPPQGKPKLDPNSQPPT